MWRDTYVTDTDENTTLPYVLDSDFSGKPGVLYFINHVLGNVFFYRLGVDLESDK